MVGLHVFRVILVGESDSAVATDILETDFEACSNVNGAGHNIACLKMSISHGQQISTRINMWSSRLSGRGRQFAQAESRPEVCVLGVRLRQIEPQSVVSHQDDLPVGKILVQDLEHRKSVRDVQSDQHIVKHEEARFYRSVRSGRRRFQDQARRAQAVRRASFRNSCGWSMGLPNRVTVRRISCPTKFRLIRSYSTLLGLRSNSSSPSFRSAGALPRQLPADGSLARC
jgi:hypothetical protein